MATEPPRGRGRPRDPNAKERVSIAMRPDAIALLKATPNWGPRVEALVRRDLGLPPE